MATGRLKVTAANESCVPNGGSAAGASQDALPSFLASTTRISAPASGIFTSTLLNLGVPVYDTERYESLIRNGGVLVSVRCDSTISLDRVREILKQTGAADISLSRDARAKAASSVSVPVLVTLPFVPELPLLGGHSGLLMQQDSGAQVSRQG
ncbi:MAG: hypothetical protein ACYDDI_11880 [Candidatus Acidiferrales bacterium]